jgi:UDP:flavonoid glycosyltransferase YjiC (YdhE family)
MPDTLPRRCLCPACRPGAPTEVLRGAGVPGDQPFWGQAVASAGVGPAPIPIDRVTTKKLAAALRFMARPEARAPRPRPAQAQ